MTNRIEPSGKGQPSTPPTSAELAALEQLSKETTTTALPKLNEGAERPRSPDPRITSSPGDPKTQQVSKEFFKNPENFPIFTEE